MRRFAAVVALSGGLALWVATPSLAARVDPPFECPVTLGGQPLTGSPVDELSPSGGRPVYFQMCLYSDSFMTEDGSLGGTGVSASPAVYWQEAGDAAPDPRIPWCVGGPATVASDTDGVAGVDELLGPEGPIIRPEQTYSTTYRAYSDYSAKGGFPEASSRELAAEMLASVADRAAPCRGSDASGAGSAVSGGAGATEPERDGSKAVGVGLATLGGGLSLLAGAGSFVAGRRPSRVGPPSAPPLETLYSGEESIRILTDGGLLQEVRGPGGELVGYRPLGDLASFLRSHPQWQPQLSRPLPTPGGLATHIAGVAFQEGPDGTISSITVAVREGPAPGSGAPAAPHAYPPTQQLSLGDRLGQVYMQALVRGVPFEAALGGTAPTPGPASGGDLLFTAEFVGHSGGYGGPDPFEPSEAEPLPQGDPSRPASPASLPKAAVPQRPPPGVDIAGWLASPGPKAIGVGDLPQLAPEVLDPSGKVTVVPWKGLQADFSIGSGRLSLSVRSPELLIPDIEISGTLAARGGALEARIDSSSVLTPGQIKKVVQGHLDRVNTTIGKAGFRVSDVRLEDGQIRLDVVPNGAAASH